MQHELSDYQQNISQLNMTHDDKDRKYQNLKELLN